MRTLTIAGTLILAGTLTCTALASPTRTIANIGLTAAAIAAISAVIATACFTIIDRIERAKTATIAEQRRLHNHTNDLIKQLNTHTTDLHTTLKADRDNTNDDVEARLTHLEGGHRRLRAMARVHFLEGILLDPETEPHPHTAHTAHTAEATTTQPC